MVDRQAATAPKVTVKPGFLPVLNQKILSFGISFSDNVHEIGIDSGLNVVQPVLGDLNWF